MKALRTTFRTLLALLLVLCVLGVAGLLALRLPAVQTRLARVATEWFYKRTAYPIEIGRVQYRFPDNLVLENVDIRDSLRQPLIYVHRLETDFSLFSLLDSVQSHVQLRRVRLVGPQVRLVIGSDGRLTLNRFINAINRLVAPPEPRPKTGRSVPFGITQASIEGGLLTYDDVRKVRAGKAGEFDPSHFSIRDLAAEVSRFLVLGDTVAAGVENLRGREPLAGLTLHELDTRFLYSDTQMRFGDLLLKLNRSVLRSYFRMEYDRAADLSDFIDKVRMRAVFSEAYLHTDDVAIFAPQLRDYDDHWQLTGVAEGRVPDFSLSLNSLRFGYDSRAAGVFRFRGLPDLTSADMDFAVAELHVHPGDLRPYAGLRTATELTRYGVLNYTGSFKGRYDRFAAKGTLRTDFGTLEPDIVLDLSQGTDAATYRGSLRMAGFAIGRLINRPDLIQHLDFEGSIEGRGFDPERADVRLDAFLNRFDFRGYTFHNTRVKGNLQAGQFDGRVAMKDTNLIFDLSGKADIRQRGAYEFDVRGRVSRALLRPLGLSREDLRVQSEVQAVWTGTDLDRLFGAAKLKNTYLTRFLPDGDRNLLIDTLFVFMPRLADSTRRILVYSDILDAKVEGPFQITQALKDLPELVEQYRRAFTTTDSARQQYYLRQEARPDVPAYRMQFETTVRNANPLTAFFYPDAYLSPNARVAGEFGIGNTSVLNLTATADTVVAGKYAFYQAEIDLNTSKFVNSDNVLAAAVITSEAQKIGPLAPSEKLFMEASWEKDHIAFTSRLRQQQSTNRGTLNGDLWFRPGGTELRFRRSRFSILDQDWNLNPGNEVVLSGQNIRIKDLTFRNVEQGLSLNGVVSSDTSQALRLVATDFNLNTLSPLIQTSIRGTLNGQVSVQDVYGNQQLDGQMHIDELVYKGFLIGNVGGTARWDGQQRRVKVDMGVVRMDQPVMQVSGTYEAANATDPLNLTATLNRTDLGIMEPFTTGLFSGLSGEASGQVEVRGTPLLPDMHGRVVIRRGQLKFDYLGVKFNVQDTVRFSGSDIYGVLSMSDEEGNPGRLRLGVYSGGNGQYALDIQASLNRFKILNTTERDNNLFFGTAFVTGNVSVESLGSLSNLHVRANATSMPGTAVTIPIDNTTQVSRADYIRFVKFNDTTATAARPAAGRSGSVGLRMDFNLNITPDARVELLINRRNRELIEAYGSGAISLGIDTKGDFTMRGNYDVERGSYAFKYETLLTKNFSIQPGGRISWYGDPYEANLDLKAVYRTRTSLAPILGDAAGQTAEFSRPYPVAVTISLKDRLQRPTISYALAVTDYPRTPQFIGPVQAFEARIQTDETELTNQVSSVLFLGTLIPLNSSQAFGQVNLLNTLSNTFTEVGASLVGSALSQLIEGVNVGISTGSGSNLSLAEQLRASVSYNVNDRLIISRDGGFTASTYGNPYANLIGDWSLEWKITADGRWRLKGFNRFPQHSLLQGILNQNVPYVGGSLLYTKSFNYIFPRKTDLRRPAGGGGGTGPSGPEDF